MGTTTVLGIPFADDTDPVAQGAAAMEALAQAVDDELAVPYWRGKATANQAVATGNNTGVSLAWQASRGFAGVGSTAPGNAPKAGLYLCSLRLRWAGSSAGTTRKAGWFIGGAAHDGAWVVMPPNGNGVLMGMSAVIAVAAGQAVLPVAFHDAGVNLDLNINGSDRSAAEVVYLGPL